MSIPVWVLLGFAGWTLVTLLGSDGVYRWSQILTKRATMSEWRADLPQGSEWYQRAMRAHANCVENLAVYAAIVVAIVATGGAKSGPGHFGHCLDLCARISNPRSYLPETDQSCGRNPLRVLLCSAHLHVLDGHVRCGSCVIRRCREIERHLTT